MRCVCAQVGDNEPMGLYVIQYRYQTDLKFLVEAYRPSHRTHMRRLESEGKLVSAGFLQDATFDGGMLMVRAESAQEALSFLEDDPFQQQGLMDELTIRAWVPTLGPDAPGFSTSFPVS